MDREINHISNKYLKEVFSRKDKTVKGKEVELLFKNYCKTKNK